MFEKTVIRRINLRSLIVTCLFFVRIEMNPGHVKDEVGSTQEI